MLPRPLPPPGEEEEALDDNLLSCERDRERVCVCLSAVSLRSV